MKQRKKRYKLFLRRKRMAANGKAAALLKSSHEGFFRDID
jgi:hypothetical protein